MPFHLHHKDEHTDLVRDIAGDAIVSVDYSRGSKYPITLISDDSLRAKFDETGLTGGRGMAIIDADAKPFEPVGDTLILKFPSQQMAREFKAWLSNSGEQGFMDTGDMRGFDVGRINYRPVGEPDIEFE